MNQTNQTTQASLGNRTMLANLTIRKKSFRRWDKKASKEVADAHNTTIDKAGRFNKILIAKGYLEPIEKAASAVYTHHVENTLPWLNNGARILPAEHYLAYTKEQRKLKAEFEQAVGEFLNEYPRAIEEARVRLNGLFSLEDYPPQADLPNSFSIITDILPTPTAEDFRISTLPSEEVDKIREQISKDMTKAATKAIHSLGNRLYEALSQMRDRLGDYSTGDAKRFYSSWVNNVEELLELIPSLNFNKDPEIEALRIKVEGLLKGHCAGSIKSSAGLAKRVSEGADDILKAMSGYCGS